MILKNEVPGWRSGFLAFLLLAPAAPAFPAPAAAPSTTASTALDLRLESLRERLGTDRLLETPDGIAFRGTSRVYEVEGEYRLWFDAEGRFTETSESPLPFRRRYDGERAEAEDWAGTRYRLELKDRAETLAMHWLMTGVWLGGRTPLTATGITEDAGTGEIRLRLELAGDPYAGDLVLDPAGGLPVRFLHETGEGVDTLEFGAFRTGEGPSFPDSVIVRRFTGELETYRFDQAAPAPAPPSSWTLEAPYDGVRFDADVPAALEVRTMYSGHLVVPVSLDGGEPQWFVFDTGAGSSVLSTAALGIESTEALGGLIVGGVGGHLESRFRRAKRLTVGPLTLEAPIFIELDLEFLSNAWGLPIAGILGFDILSRAVVEVDLFGGEISLFDPALYALSGGTWQPLVLSDRHPCVEATFEGHPALFKLDTGAAGTTVMFHAPFVTRNGLLEGRETEEGSSHGVGGSVRTRTGTVSSFELGGRRHEDLAVGFAVEAKGAFADPYTAGNIGGNLLTGIRLVLDYPHRRIAYLPAPGDPIDPD